MPQKAVAVQTRSGEVRRFYAPKPKVDNDGNLHVAGLAHFAAGAWESFEVYEAPTAEEQKLEHLELEVERSKSHLESLIESLARKNISVTDWGHGVYSIDKGK